MKTVTLLLSCTLLAACATPVTTLKNDTTGQVARCGGDRTGSMMGGMIGYSMNEGDANRCVNDYLEQGFKIISQH